MSRLKEDLIKIVKLGSGVKFNGFNYSTDDLVLIVSSASNNNATIILTNMSLRLTDDLIKIAYASKCNIIFDVE